METPIAKIVDEHKGCKLILECFENRNRVHREYDNIKILVTNETYYPTHMQHNEWILTSDIDDVERFVNKLSEYIKQYKAEKD